MLVTMSDKDLSRYKVINDVCEHRLRRSDAAQILNLSERQVQRLIVLVPTRSDTSIWKEESYPLWLKVLNH